MTPSVATNESDISLRLALLKARKQGAVPNGNALEELAMRVDEQLRGQLEASRQEIIALTERVAKELSDAPLIEANEEKMALLVQLREIRDGLKESVSEMKRNLEDEKKEKTELLERLKYFREVLKRTSALNCSGAFYQMSERGSYRIVTGHNPKPSTSKYDPTGAGAKRPNI